MTLNVFFDSSINKKITDLYKSADKKYVDTYKPVEKELIDNYVNSNAKPSKVYIDTFNGDKIVIMLSNKSNISLDDHLSIGYNGTGPNSLVKFLKHYYPDFDGSELLNNIVKDGQSVQRSSFSAIIEP